MLRLVFMLSIAIGDGGFSVGLSMRVENSNVDEGSFVSPTPETIHCNAHMSTICGISRLASLSSDIMTHFCQQVCSLFDCDGGLGSHF